MTFPCASSLWRRSIGILALGAVLVGCSVIEKPTRSVVYDFGPGATVAAAPPTAVAKPAVVLAEIAAPGALDSTAVLYRLAYSDAQQLLPYAQARWSMPPAQLLQQQLRKTLGRHHVVMREGDGMVAGAQRPLVLVLELDEFSQLFASPTESVGLVRVHASVVRPAASGDQLLAQRDFVEQRAAPSADAAGGVRALTAATDGLLEEISAWLMSLR